ncbi:FAD-dependent oxidoreductase [uncultured Cetobacterium sp.]|uniref:NAD(P)/FAD-dependent oxidoreductase n=1 Tax=uncultured Cetobacterium sp. TaxID=527638 RepID=UPI00260C3639|nr:FAD-dependent oxidoreductase [uncultured Cetobacterium sp.]
MENKILLLVGGGHAHVYLLNKIIKEKQKFKTILISTNKYQFYSGMASAYIENIYSDEDICFDLKVLCKLGGIEFLEDKVVSIDPQKKLVILSSGQKVRFDVVSFDTGSELKIDEKNINHKNLIGIKPLTNLKEIKERLQNSSLDKIKVLVIGAGAAGIELSFGVKELGKQLSKVFEVHLVDRGKSILPTFPKKIQEIVLKRLSENNISLYLNEEVESIETQRLVTKKKMILEYDIILWAGGPTSNPMYEKAAMSVDEKGYMIVNNFLQNIDYPYIFGAGDCVGIKNYSYIKKVGVYAIKEAPYLWNNIVNFFNKTPLKSYVPQKDFLLILSLGNKEGVLSYKGFVLKGYLIWKLKNYIDEGFMRKFKNKQKKNH